MKINELYSLEASENAIDYGLEEYRVPKTATDTEDAFFEKVEELIPNKALATELSNLFYDMYYDSVFIRESYAYERGFKRAFSLCVQCID